MNNKPHILILILLASLASFAAILVAPGIPALANIFHVSTSNMEWALSIYLIGYAVGQLIWGPISDRQGRKYTLQLGIAIGLLATVFCIIAGFFQSYRFFIVTRFLIGLGFSSGLVMSMAMIADTHTKTESRQTFSLIVLCFAFVPAIAIVSGGIIVKHLNYQWLNYLIASIAVASLISTRYLTDTSAAKRNKPHHSLKAIANNHWLLLTNKNYIVFITIYSLIASISYVFNGVSPFIGINIDHINPEPFSFMSIIPSAGILVGGFLSSKLAAKYSAKKLIFFGTILTVMSGLIMTVFFISGDSDLLPLFACGFIMFTGMSLAIPNASMSAIHSANASASAAGLMNAVGLCVASLLAYLTGSSVLKLPVALPLVLTLVGIISVLLLIILPNRTLASTNQK